MIHGAPGPTKNQNEHQTNVWLTQPIGQRRAGQYRARRGGDQRGEVRRQQTADGRRQTADGEEHVLIVGRQGLGLRRRQRAPGSSCWVPPPWPEPGLEDEATRLPQTARSRACSGVRKASAGSSVGPRASLCARGPLAHRARWRRSRRGTPRSRCGPVGVGNPDSRSGPRAIRRCCSCSP
jgi:hypothetical protein